MPLPNSIGVLLGISSAWWILVLILDCVHILTQFMQKLHNYVALGRSICVVRYLKGCMGHGIFLKANDTLPSSAFCDSDWSACPITRRSLSAYIVFLGDSPVPWKTKKHDTVSLFSVETEYRAMSVTIKELKWIKELL